MAKFALVHIGNDEVYSLEFVAAEIANQGHEFKWFDGDPNGAEDGIIAWRPDVVCFSPLTTFFAPAVTVARKIKAKAPGIRTAFGGAHISASSNHVHTEGIDIAVTGPVYDTIDQLLNAPPKSVVHGHPVMPDQMNPRRREYFETIERIGRRHRKALMSHFGCVYNCSYCATSRTREAVGAKDYRTYYLTRRPVEAVIEEARIFREFDTKEVALEDDDILEGAGAEEWLDEFIPLWKRDVNLPVYGNVTPKTVVGASDKMMRSLADLAQVVHMGVQVSRAESLKLFNRQFQKEDQVKAAFDRLKAFGVRTKLELIIGLPVEDPIGDAIDSIKMAQRVGAGTFAAAFPLMLYPGTALYKHCKDNGIPMNEDCSFEWYGGIGSIKFDPETERRLRNLSKLATFFIKYNVEERWMRAMMEMNLTEDASRAVSENNYLESLIFRLGPEAESSFAEVLTYTNFRF